jgi:hypothetical protein
MTGEWGGGTTNPASFIDLPPKAVPQSVLRALSPQAPVARIPLRREVRSDCILPPIRYQYLALSVVNSSPFSCSSLILRSKDSM